MNNGSDIGSQLLDLMLRAGSSWMLYLLLGLSLAAVAVMLDRIWFFLQERPPRERARRGAGGAAQERAGGRARQADRRALDGGGGRARLPEPRRRRRRGGRGAQGGRDRAGAGALRAPAGVPRHAGQQRAVHRPVRHRARHHPRVPRSGRELAAGDAGGHGRHRRGAGRDRRRPARRVAGGRRLQHLHAPGRARGVAPPRCWRTRSWRCSRPRPAQRRPARRRRRPDGLRRAASAASSPRST